MHPQFVLIDRTRIVEVVLPLLLVVAGAVGHIFPSGHVRVHVSHVHVSLAHVFRVPVSRVRVSPILPRDADPSALGAHVLGWAEAAPDAVEAKAYDLVPPVVVLAAAAAEEDEEDEDEEEKVKGTFPNEWSAVVGNAVVGCTEVDVGTDG